ncbi:MAG TPA: preprotein translocase subunit SecY [Candidatus Absconditabacterales bacterium]|nr:preprotein translocase subunit SecY [Candidatus Absconditabacterales bacterium]HOQ79038.1 preprotein translocase subunit SecY [Candidatus Absconditabacterales bacterium]HPK27640.1 preprotein translocase subunit SecY [Candidatus Absconditabacterales bacterium]
MNKFKKKFKNIIENKSLMNKIFFTLGILAIYRFLVHVPVPFVNIHELMGRIGAVESGGLGYFVMMLGGSLENFALIAIGLAPFINSSIIMQLLGSVVPQLEQLREQGESGQQKIQQYTRYLTVPLAFLQGIGMVFFINYLLGGNVIDTSIGNLLLAAFIMTVGAILLMRLGELITEKGISNGISILIFSSIVAGITKNVYGNFAGTGNVLGMFIFMIVLILGLIILSIFILKSTKEVPIIYARKGKIQESSILPLPMNPVGMIPIIFSMAFVSFPYLVGKMIVQFQPMNTKLVSMANRVEANLNIYSQQPSMLSIIFYFILIIIFTFFYTLITFSPDRMADDIQKKGGFVPGIRPGQETSKYLNRILMHLCLWGGAGLAFIGIYSYILNYIPFIQNLVQSLGSLPIVVTGSGVIIMVGVVTEIINKVESELIMQKYERYDTDTVNKSLRDL